MADKGPYKIEISNEEYRFLQYALNLMDNAINGIPSDTRYDTDVNKIGLREAIDYLGLIIGTRDKTLEDAAGNDKQKALGLLNSLHEKLLIGIVSFWCASYFNFNELSIIGCPECNNNCVQELPVSNQQNRN